MARSLAVLGTGSDVGKSLVAAALCRLLYRAGVRVVPFKSQNMSLNSFVTPTGGEMGRAQVLQAQACGLVPHVDMNPILLKPEANDKSQVIVQGKVWHSQRAAEYFESQSTLFELVKASFMRLAKEYEVVIIEGAGSAAELNLRDRDIVNWQIVEMADASVVLVADIDRGGVFAQVIGTMDLLASEERRRVIGIVINKFRGNARLFDDGVRILEERTGIPVLGVLPHLPNLELDQEDSVGKEGFRFTPFSPQTVNVAVVLLPHMSNFTDFNQLGAESDVRLRYVAKPQELHGADIVILPGSKTTMHDLQYLQAKGFEEALTEHVKGLREIVGICGGFQMLGKEISDPHGVESGGWAKGFGLLDITTELLTEKKTVQVRGEPLHLRGSSVDMAEGYEIHMGMTKRNATQPCFRLQRFSENSPSTLSLCRGEERNPKGKMDEDEFDGAMRADGLVWGTYIHGVFDQPGFRRLWLNRVRERKGLPSLAVGISEAVSIRLSQRLDRWADHVEEHLTIEPIFSHLGLK